MALFAGPRERRQFRAAILFIMPNLVGFLIFTAFPVVFSLGVSFTDWPILERPVFVGLKNFRELLFDDPYFYKYLWNTLVLMAGMPAAIAGSLCLALVLSKKLKGQTIFRTLFYLPTITGGVATLILWRYLYDRDNGLVNRLIGGATYGLDRVVAAVAGLVGLDAPSLVWTGPDWLGSTPGWMSGVYWAKPAMILMGIWAGVGGTTMLLYIAALANVPDELYEAAEIDGAGRWAKFWSVTWPMISPTTFFIVVMGVIGGLQGGFMMAYVMTGGGPAGATTTVSFYIWSKAFTEYQMGYASALAWVLFVIVFGLTIANWRIGNKLAHYQ